MYPVKLFTFIAFCVLSLSLYKATGAMNLTTNFERKAPFDLSTTCRTSICYTCTVYLCNAHRMLLESHTRLNLKCFVCPISFGTHLRTYVFYIISVCRRLD